MYFYDLESQPSEYLNQLYYELCNFKNLDEDQKDFKQDIADILGRRGWRV